MIIGATVTVALTIASVVVFIAGSESQPVTTPQATSVFLGNGCNGCHVLNDLPGNAQIGPDLTDVDDVAATRVEGLSAEEYVRQSLREPPAFVVRGYGLEMPTLPLSGEDIDALVSLLLADDEA